MSAPKLHRRSSYKSSICSPDYFIIHHLGRFTSRRIADRLDAGKTVLDVGCGEQPLRATVEAAGARYVSADVTQNLQGTVDHLCQIGAIPLASESVDFILCTEVMEHVSETREAFEEMTRLLKPGGVLLLTTPLLYPLHEEPHDFVRLTPFQIERLANEVDLEVIEMERAGNEFEVLASFAGRCWSWIFDVLKFKPLRRCCAIGIRWFQAAANGLAIVAGRVLPLEQPPRVFLNTMCVLRKKPGSSHEGRASDSEKQVS